MNRRRGNPRPLQPLADTVRLVLHLREDDRASHLWVTKERHEQVVLLVPVDVKQPLANLFHRRLLGIDRDPGRVDQQPLGQGLHSWRQCRGEEAGTPLARQLGDDALDVVDESHVQHTIRLVEDEGLHAVQFHEPLPHQVEQAARRGDDDVDPPVHRLFLRVLTHTAKDHRVGHLQKPAVRRDAVADLRGQLTRRRKDQRTGAAAFRAAFLGGQLLQQRDGERGGFAGAGLCAAAQVPSIHLRWDGLRLHRRRRGVTFLPQRVLNLRDQRAEDALHPERLHRFGDFAGLGFPDCTGVLVARPGWPAPFSRFATGKAPTFFVAPVAGLPLCHVLLCNQAGDPFIYNPYRLELEENEPRDVRARSEPGWLETGGCWPPA